MLWIYILLGPGIGNYDRIAMGLQGISNSRVRLSVIAAQQTIQLHCHNLAVSVAFAAVIVIRALLCGVYIGPLIFGNSHTAEGLPGPPKGQ